MRRAGRVPEAAGTNNVPVSLSHLADHLDVEQLAPGIWRHVFWFETPGFNGESPSNGLVVIEGKEAALINMPWTED